MIAHYTSILTTQDKSTSHIPQIHQYKIVAQIPLIFNLFLTAPVLVREIYQARGDDVMSL